METPRLDNQKRNKNNSMTSAGTFLRGLYSMCILKSTATYNKHKSINTAIKLTT